jgi:hypothetical protein
MVEETFLYPEKGGSRYCCTLIKFRFLCQINMHSHKKWMTVVSVVKDLRYMRSLGGSLKGPHVLAL